MATVKLRAPLKDLAGGNREVAIDGGSVGEVLKELERQHPRIVGWVLDEHGRVRPHVNVFVDGERVREDAAVAPARRSTSSPRSQEATMTELLVGTKKGLFVLEGDAGSEKPFEVKARAFPGNVVEFAIRDPRNGEVLASVTSGHYGPRVMVTRRPHRRVGADDGIAYPEGDDWTLERIWSIKPGEADGLMYAGVAPAACSRRPTAG